MARPKKNIDEANVGKLASYGCNNCEIADFFGVDEATIRRRFPETLAKKRAEVRHKLRKAQVELAMSGNVTMLIWLGKQLLGQTDKVESKIENAPKPDAEKVREIIKLIHGQRTARPAISRTLE